MSDTRNLPQPDPALRRLDRLVDAWTMEGNLVGSDPGTDTFPSTVFSEDGTFSGGWRPNPGADQTVNVPYDIAGTVLHNP